MRNTGLIAATIIMFVATTGLALAQATEGPLAAPDEASHAVAAKPAKKVKHKKVAHRDTKRGTEDVPAEGSSPRRDIALPGSGTAADPLSFGMKWNGNSDNARETRVQNYNAGANGSGAEVGMKLHF